MHQTDVTHVSGFLVTYVSACSGAWRYFFSAGAFKFCRLTPNNAAEELRVPSRRCAPTRPSKERCPKHRNSD